MRKAICGFCKSQFDAVLSTAEYCSPKCRVYAFRARKLVTPCVTNIDARHARHVRRILDYAERVEAELEEANVNWAEAWDYIDWLEAALEQEETKCQHPDKLPTKPKAPLSP